MAGLTPTIDDIEAALPHVPAGLHCGDLTEADERRAFAVTVHEIVVRAMGDVHPVIAATLQAVGEVMAHGGTVYTADDGHRLTLGWPQYRPGVDLSDANVGPAPVPPENQDGRNNGVSSWRARLTWNVDSIDLLSPWPPPSPGTHESDLGVGLDDWDAVIRREDGSPWNRLKVNSDGYVCGGDVEYDRAAAWSRENAR